jgi:hypothetical protein
VTCNVAATAARLIVVIDSSCAASCCSIATALLAGYKARGDADLLCKCGEAHGLTVDIVELQDANNASLGTASSTRVRELVTSGNFEAVPSYLGRRYSLLVPRPALQAVGMQRPDNTAGVWDFAVQEALNQVPGDGGYEVKAFDRADEEERWVDYAGVNGSLSVKCGVCRLVLCDTFHAGDKGIRLEIIRARDLAAMSALHCEPLAASEGDS